MLNKVKTYLGITDNDSDSLLEILIELAEDTFELITGASASDYQSIILQMTVEAFNKWGSEGIGSLTFGSNNESTLADYSDGLQRQIRRVRKVKVI